jgi:hypothetical protein
VNELQSIAAKAARARLRFLLAGGHAVIAHGHQRTTFDIDLIVQGVDRDAWFDLAESLGYELHVGSMSTRLRYVNYSSNMVRRNSIRRSKRLAARSQPVDLDLPDWSGMDDSSKRVTAEAPSGSASNTRPGFLFLPLSVGFGDGKNAVSCSNYDPMSNSLA